MKKLSRPSWMVWLQSTLALVAISLLAATAVSAQPPQGRVFTNEDIQSAPPPAAEPSPAASPGESPTASQPASPSDASEEMPAAPPDEVARLTAMLDAIGQAADVLYDKMQQGTADEATLARWDLMRDSLSGVMAEFRQFVAQAQSEAERAAAAPPENAPAQQ